MFRALYTAASGMLAQQLNLDNIANNLANASTTGFRGTRLQFQDLIYQELVVPGSAASQQTTVSTGLQIGLGTRASASEVMQTQGEPTSTGNTLDLMIQGAGFFQVKLTNGETAYTRAGTFHLDQQGNVTTAQGDPLEPSVAIPVGSTNISIGSDGTVTVTMPGQTNSQQVGTIQLATFSNPGGLMATGNNLFTATTASGDPIVGTPGGSEGIGTLQQAMLENSNINVVDEFIQMIVTQRAYESNSKVVQAADQMLQDVNNLSH